MSNSINPALIPRADVDNLSHTFLSAVKRFYEDPAHERAFAEWKEKQTHQKSKRRQTQ